MFITLLLDPKSQSYFVAVAQGGVLAEEESDSEVVYSDADVTRKNNFLASCRELRDKVAAVEAIQIDILITLLTSADVTSEVCNWVNDYCGFAFECVLRCTDISEQFKYSLKDWLFECAYGRIDINRHWLKAHLTNGPTYLLTYLLGVGTDKANSKVLRCCLFRVSWYQNHSLTVSLRTVK